MMLARRLGERAAVMAGRAICLAHLWCGRLEIERTEASLSVAGGEPQEGVSWRLFVGGDKVMRCRS